MIGSLTKIIFFIIIIATVSIAAGAIIDAGGVITMQFASYEVSLTPIQGIIGIILCLSILLAAKWIFGIIVAIFKFFNGDETAITRYFNKNKEERGYKALADSMVSMAAGEGKDAINNANRAERLLKRPQLTNLVSAQAAEKFGDNKRALKYYKRLLKNDQTRFVGLQGLLKQKLLEGDTETALLLAEKAFSIRPKHEQTLNILFDLQTEKLDWKGAQKTIKANVRAGKLPKDVGLRREAILLLADAKEMLEAGEIDKGKAAAIAANKSSPDLIPAAILAAEMYMLENNKRSASRVLKKTWGLNPHPDLATAFAEINLKETSSERRKRFNPLIKLKSEHSETKLLIAELAIGNEDFPAARRAIKNLTSTNPTVRSLALMAAIEKGEGADEKTVRAWLNKALTASRGPQWVCEKCSNIHSSWQPRCGNCETFDSLSWKEPLTDDTKLTNEMLDFTAGILTGSESSPPPVANIDDAEVVDD
ncbi:MAG: heme biosynthesis protein HemY [Amylibacter sp.]|nr:heme biosynthesis protein HemY [Amylibacter sp.]